MAKHFERTVHGEDEVTQEAGFKFLCDISRAALSTKGGPLYNTD